MAKTFEEKLKIARETIEEVKQGLIKHSGEIHPKVDDVVRRLLDEYFDVDHWSDLYQARTVALKQLEDLESDADIDGRVSWGRMNQRMPYRQARFLAIQLYLSSAWALADCISEFVGTIFCNSNETLLDSSHPQLLSHFIEHKAKTKTAYFSLFLLKDTYGWPVAILYHSRNLFVHDGGRIDGVDFFEGSTPTSAFRVSPNAWDKTLKAINDIYDIEETQCRPRWAFPSDPTKDFREVLKACDSEIDQVLGVLMGTACSSLKSHIDLILGDD